MVSPAGAARGAAAVRSGPTAMIGEMLVPMTIGDTRKATTIAAVLNEAEAKSAMAIMAGEKAAVLSVALAAADSAGRDSDEAVSAAAAVLAAVHLAAVVSAGLAPIRLDLHRDHHAMKAGAGRKVAMIAAGLNLDHLVGIAAGLIGAAVLPAAARRRDVSAITLARAARIMLSPRIAADRGATSAIIPANATGAAGRMPHAVIIAGRTIRQADITPAGHTAIAAEQLGANLFITVRDTADMADMDGTAGITDRTAASPIISTAAVGETVLRCTGRTADGDRRAILVGDRIMAADRTISPAFMADLLPRSIVPRAALNRAAGETGEMAARNAVATFRLDDRARAPTGGAASWSPLAGR